MKKEFGEVLSYISSMTAEWPHARHRPHGPELTRQKKRTGPQHYRTLENQLGWWRPVAD
jgi:hypothetical protein